MLLSIVMMVKNEEKFLKKTLVSIAPLRESIDSELIILDTGSSDQTVEIAKEFTDNVYFATWNNNFADMRNISISYAKGEWILVLDADEVLKDYSKIVTFFTDRLYENYNSASISIRNKLSNIEEEDSLVSTLTLVRMFKNDDISYKGKIHEQAEYKMPRFDNIAVFDHFGYLYEDEEFKLNKLKRNSEILIEALKENPESPYDNFQMAKNLLVEGKNKEALEYMEKAYGLYRKLGIEPPYLYSGLANLYILNGMYKKAENICNKYIKKDINNIDIYYYLGKVQRVLGKMKESIKSFERYLYLVDNYEMSTQANNLCADGNCMSDRDRVISTIISMNYMFEEYSMVIDSYSYINSFKIKKASRRFVFLALEKINRSHEILDYYEEIPDSDIEREYFYCDLEMLIKSVKDDNKKELYKIFSKIDGNYGKLNFARLRNNISIEECRSILREEKNVIYSSLIELAIEEVSDIIRIVHDFDVIWITRYINYMIGCRKELGLELYKYLTNIPYTEDIEKIKLYKIFSQAVLENIILDDDKYKNLFYLYVMCHYKYMRYLYKNFDDNFLLNNVCNDTDRFIIEFKNLIKYKNLNAIKYIQKLKVLIKEYPTYKKIIQIVIKDIEEDLNESEEFKKLKAQLIDNIEGMLNNGNLKDARGILDEYSKYFKDDIRILNIKAILYMLEGNFDCAENMLRKAYLLDFEDEDTLFNIQYLESISTQKI